MLIPTEAPLSDCPDPGDVRANERRDCFDEGASPVQFELKDPGQDKVTTLF